jgi:hypothetical protein
MCEEISQAALTGAAYPSLHGRDHRHRPALATAGPNVDNLYFPLPVGRQWVHREGDQRVEVTVTDRTRLMTNGVVARVVRDEVTRKGVPVELTDGLSGDTDREELIRVR